MDNKTIITYNQAAAHIATLHDTLIPEDIYRLVDRFFIRGSGCIDVGCGNGRDSYRLLQQGYPITGIDAAEGMLVEAKKRYPGLCLIHDSLPLLSTIDDSTFTNVLCSAVIMHLRTDQIQLAVANLLRIMVIGGVIVISFRGTNNADQRENGKLYTAISPEKLITAFAEAGASLLHYENNYEEGRCLKWHNLVFRKSPHPEV